MVKFLLKLVILFAIGWFIYATLFGNAQEKQVAGNIRNGFVQMVGGIKDAITIEANKGTFQKAFDKTVEGINALHEKSKSGTLSTDFSAKIADLEAKKKALEEKMKAAQRLKNTAQDEQLKKDFNAIAEEIKQVSEQMDKAKK